MVDIAPNQPHSYHQSYKPPASDSYASPMRFEKNRLASFKNWTCPYMKPEDLASAGFYFVNYADVVKCAFCSVEIGQWEEGDDARCDHQRWYNNCPFLRGKNVGNVPIGQAGGASMPLPSGEDTCGKYGIELRPNSVPEREAGHSGGSSGEGGSQGVVQSLKKFGVVETHKATYPDYSTEHKRLMTFKDWPRSMKQRPEDLSKAGFFYNGKGDQTLCYHCGGGLKDWEEDDDPWEQHAKWFSHCNYLLLQKGHDFIKDVCNKDPAVLTPQEAKGLVSGEAAAALDLESASKDTVETTTKVTEEDTSSNSNKELNACKICYQEKMNVLFLPCRHLAACANCAANLTNCAICRHPVEASINVYVP